MGLTEINATLAAAIRTFSAAVAITIFQHLAHGTNNPSFIKNAELTKLSLTVLSGMLGYGVTGIAYVAVMQRAGAGRTVLITSLAPVFVFILSALFLKEKPTLPSLMGTLICVIGIMFLSV
jgi:uncharacterized membrane protein